MKILATVFFCLIASKSFSQVGDEVIVTVDSNLNIRLYDPPKEIRQMGCRIFSYTKDDIFYQVVVNDSILFNANSKRQFDISITGMRDGYVNNDLFKGYTVVDQDSVLDGMPGKFIHIFSAPTNRKIKEVFTFATLQNDHAYTISTIILTDVDERIKKDVQYFFKMLHFNGSPYHGFSKK